jgi:Ca2+-binding RTX toxin-like protein
MDGGPGNDTLFGGPGDDRMISGDGDDYLDGEDGMDAICDSAANGDATCVAATCEVPIAAFPAACIDPN